MVFCTYCGQSFTRDEHLERHILTHTNVKPFKCFTCHMSFARRDLLQRHYTVHGRDSNQEPLPASNGMIPKSAGRTPIACSNCAKTKTKCDKKFPCSRCASRNLRCTLRPTRRTSKNVNVLKVVGDGQSSGNNSDNGSNEPSSGSNKSSPQPQAQAQPESQTPSQKTSPIINNPPNVRQNLPNGVISPLPTPTSQTGFLQTTPLSGYEDFTRTNQDGSDNGSSPQFMMDWAQMQLPMGYEGMARPDMMLGPEMGLDPNAMPLGAQGEPMVGMLPDFSHSMASLQTPIETPKFERHFSDLDLGNSTPIFQPPSRHLSHTSTHSSHSVPAPAGDNGGELSAIVAAQDGWSVFRCTPTVSSAACPRTARPNLERLEQSLRNHETWSKWSPTWDESEFSSGEQLAVMQLQESTRDKLLAITQAFLHKALDIHQDNGNSLTPGSASPSRSLSSNFVLLPPARVLEYFLRSYANSFERYYSMTSRGLLDANELMYFYNEKASSLLILMMIAQGAMAIPSIEGRWLAGGLTEACRISLFDLIEKNIIMSGDPIVLHSALLFTALAAWSGDKWQMDIAMGQRGMYFAMLRHSGVLEPRQQAPSQIDRSNTDALWNDWIQHESRSRLIYSWVMVDQDLSLFHDTAPLFSVTEFGAPMPDADRLWHAKTASEWTSIFEQVHEFSGGFSSIGSGARPLSLRDLFRHFLDDEIVAQGIELTPLHLRLLLHPLQSLVCQYCQLLSCFSDTVASRQRARAVTAASTRVRLEEVQSLLQRWYDLADRYSKANPTCPMMQANLAMFHLISLNAITNFAEIEKLARREGVDGSYPQPVWLHRRCISDVEEAIFHCGQVLRLIRAMPRGVRPPWWAAAVYRAALLLWTDSLTHNDAVSNQPSGLFPVPGPSFAVDALPPDHPLVVRYLTKREGVPTLTKRDGSQMAIDNAFGVLSHCVEVINEGVSTRFADGIRGKLEKLARG
ncbi:transcription factor Bmr1 [Viridothelium virens]|uniref:Transcription factor Bmr1 n=1 Tax=Viridothelium virens TaxID=1048519 RepID=A0A6A6HA50_VIRVR|nr:transcription factor Bmr1 [Viridothelium virens]